MKRCLLALLAVLPLSAQIRMTGLEGLEAKAKSSVVVGLDPAMLQMAAGFLTQGSPEAAKAKELIGGLKAITVRTMEFGEAGQYKIEDLASIREQLRAPAWSKMISVDEKKSQELVEVYTRTEQGKMAGLTIIAAQPKELAIVSIEGTIDLAALAQLGGQFGIPNIPIPGVKGAQKGTAQKGTAQKGAAQKGNDK